MLKIIVSAIACSPIGGSEGAVGWSTVKYLSSKYNVRVVTSKANLNDWKEAELKGEIPENIEVKFIGTNKRWPQNRFLARLESWRRFKKFNKEILSVVSDWHEESPCDLIHQVTYATWRVPSPLWRIPVPFVWGPIGGVSVFPKRFYKTLDFKSRLFEKMRGLQSWFVIYSKGFRQCLENAAVVIAANNETKNFLLVHRPLGSIYILPVIYFTKEKCESYRATSKSMGGSDPILLFCGGNLIGSKGLNFAIKALKRVKDAGYDFRYTIAGGGPAVKAAKKLTKLLDLENEINFHSGFKGRDYIAKLKDSEIYLLPSFRETTPITFLEAILSGCYPVVADASAPGEITQSLGITPAATDTEEILLDGLSQQIIDFAQKREEYQRRAIEFSNIVEKKFSFQNFEKVIGEAYETALKFR